MDLTELEISFMNAISDTEIQVLDHGVVKLIETMGTDASIAEAARVSYSNNKNKEFTEDQDRKLIDYLLSHGHTSPFEMCELKFYIKCPMFVARQVVRHRTANINEVSGRYSILPNEFYIPDPVMICTQSTDNNQGRSEVDKDRLTSVEREAISEAIKKHSIESYELYEHLIGDYNLSRELARMVLPVNVYTEFVWKMDLNNLFKFLMLRMDHHTQIETRMFANAIGILTESKFPLAYEAFNEHIRYATKFSMTETSYLRYRSDHTVLLSKLPEVEKRIGKRRAKEFKEKLGVK